jgi:DNA-binding MarR family transcriptional regulator
MNEDLLKLDVASKEVVNRYKPFLDEISLTYTQYIAMMVLWDKKTISVKDLGACLYLDSGTLTPLLKRLETKGYVKRTRSKDDERIVNINITQKGLKLKDEAVNVPAQMMDCLNLSQEESKTLYELLYKVIGK